MMERICNNCRAKKDIGMFYKWSRGPDGYRVSCKECTNAQNAKSSIKNPAAVLRAKSKYKELHKEDAVENCAKYRKGNPIKYNAHKKVHVAVRNGTLVRKSCEVCGSTKTVAHHDDYSKPLDVRWLCSSHHREWHIANGEALNG